MCLEVFLAWYIGFLTALCFIGLVIAVIREEIKEHRHNPSSKKFFYNTEDK